MPSSERCSIRAFSFLRTRPPSRCSFSLCSGKRPEPWLPKNGAPPSPTFNFSFPNVSPPAERKLHRKSDSLWASKETLRALWDMPTLAAGAALYKRWHFWATHSRLDPVKKVATMIRRHLPGVLSYFTHRITNSASETLNSTIQMIKKRAFGFRSFDNFRVAILFRCGGLQLHP